MAKGAESYFVVIRHDKHSCADLLANSVDCVENGSGRRIHCVNEQVQIVRNFALVHVCCVPAASMRNQAASEWHRQQASGLRKPHFSVQPCASARAVRMSELDYGQQPM
jgi:hypothetical protein